MDSSTVGQGGDLIKLRAGDQRVLLFSCAGCYMGSSCNLLAKENSETSAGVDHCRTEEDAIKANQYQSQKLGIESILTTISSNQDKSR